MCPFPGKPSSILFSNRQNSSLHHTSAPLLSSLQFVHVFPLEKNEKSYTDYLDVVWEVPHSHSLDLQAMPWLILSRRLLASLSSSRRHGLMSILVSASTPGSFPLSCFMASPSPYSIIALLQEFFFLCDRSFLMFRELDLFLMFHNVPGFIMLLVS